MRLAANLTLLYESLPVSERFAAAAEDGFRYVEILQPYDHPPEWYARQLQCHGLELVLINTPVLSSEYPVGMAAQPSARHLFGEAMQRAVAVCRATGCRAIHVMAGKTDTHHSRSAQLATLCENLRWANDTWPDLALHLEALNRVDVPDYFYSLPEQVAQALIAIGREQVGMQFDFYHVVKEDLQPAEQVRCYGSLIRHVQIAGASARAEPDLNRDGLLAGIQSLKTQGYDGYLGLEYRPAKRVGDGLSWAVPILDKNLIVYQYATK